MEEMEIRQCRGLAREERVTERVQDQPVGDGIGRTSGALKLLCGNTKSRKEEYVQQCDLIQRTRKTEEPPLRKECKGEEPKEWHSGRTKHRLEDMVQKCQR